jgi:c-di-GMP-binding flagellar brake protein YcgR
VEKRQYPRVEVPQPVLYFTDIYPRPKMSTTVDLSVGGTRIETPYSPILGERLELSLAIQPHVIKSKGKVVHIRMLDNGKLEAGIQFDELSEHDRLYLRQYLFHVMEKQALEAVDTETSP